MKSHAELTKRQLQVLPYLLSCPTYEEAARHAHVGVKQIYCWLKTSAFKTELDRRHNEIIEEAVSRVEKVNYRDELPLRELLQCPKCHSS